jgi:hypothetical protein
MKTIDLKKESPSVSELLAMARKKSVLLVSKDGATFVLEEADETNQDPVKIRLTRQIRSRECARGGYPVPAP